MPLRNDCLSRETIRYGSRSTQNKSILTTRARTHHKLTPVLCATRATNLKASWAKTTEINAHRYTWTVRYNSYPLWHSDQHSPKLRAVAK